MSGNLRTPRGTKDILPDEQKYWRYLSQVVADQCESFGCGKIDTPLFEYGEVFTKGLGTGSDIVTKEMYQLTRAASGENQNPGENDESKALVLRPEITAGIVRAWLEHGMRTWPQPVKLYYEGTCFRYERPQAGRYRAFNQFGVEIIGDDNPLTDASIIYLAYQILQKLGIGINLVIDIFPLYNQECAKDYR